MLELAFIFHYATEVINAKQLAKVYGKAAIMLLFQRSKPLAFCHEQANRSFHELIDINGKVLKWVSQFFKCKPLPVL